MLCTGFGVGGAELLTLHTSAALNEAGFRCSIGYLKGGGELSPQAAERGIDVRRFSRSSDLDPVFAVRSIRSFCIRRRVDVLHTNLAHANLLGRFALFGFPSVRKVATYHNADPRLDTKNPSMSIIRGADHVLTVWCRNSVATAVSEHARRFHKRLKLLPGTRIVALPTGVFRPISEHCSRVDSGRFAFLCVGRLEAVKGYDTAIRAVRLLQNRGSHGFELRIVGEGSQKVALRELARSLGVEDEVEFVNSKTAVDEELAGADAFISASHAEGLGLAILEAFAAGVPVVSTLVGGTCDFIYDGETALVFEPGDSTTLADRMTHMMEQSSTRKRLAKNARDVYEKRYTFAGYLERLVKVYES